MRGELAALIDQGKNHDEIIQAFITKYGSQEMLGAPLDKGFNRLAWLFPYLVGATSAVAVGFAAVQVDAQAGRAPTAAPRRSMRRSTSASTMSSETSTKPRSGSKPDDASRDRPAFSPGSSSCWPRSAARRRSPSWRAARAPTAVILLSVLMATAALVGYAALRTVRPLVSPEDDRTAMIGQRTRVALEREKMLALRSIKELEFDRAMGKLSDEDWQRDVGPPARPRGAADAAARRRRRLPRADRDAISRSGSETRRRLERDARRDVAARRRGSPTRACVDAANGIDADAKFCKQCGATRVNDADAQVLQELRARSCDAALAVSLCPLCPLCPLCRRRWSRSGGFAMPDPKQMSGIPRPVDDLPNGAISVRLIRGELSNNIAGHPVELHVGAEGHHGEDRRERPRAVRRRCRPGATVKATADVDGEQLESQEFPAPAQRRHPADAGRDRQRRRRRAPAPAAPAVTGAGRHRRRSRAS